MGTYWSLILISLGPALLSGFFYFLSKKSFFSNLDVRYKQLIYGVSFGILAILGTEFGVPIEGAQLNCRDGAVITAGLFFGAPAGIIAGIIGGVERWISVLWGVGTFTQIACSLSTLIAGIYAALLRYFIFEQKNPSWPLSLATGVVIEVFHMTMVFLTNLDNPMLAMDVVRACAVPMILCNSLSVFLSCFILTLLKKQKLWNFHAKKHISQIARSWLLFVVVISFSLTSFFLYSFQDGIAQSQAQSTLSQAIEDLEDELDDSVHSSLLEITEQIHVAVLNDPSNLSSIQEEYAVSEINIIDSNGIVSNSTNPDKLSFNFNESEQFKDTLSILGQSDGVYIQNFLQHEESTGDPVQYISVTLNDELLQVGWNQDAYYSINQNLVQHLTNYRRVGDEGFLIILDYNYQILSVPEWYTGSLTSQDFTSCFNESHELLDELLLHDTSYLYDFMEHEGYIILSCLPKTEAFEAKDIVVYINTFLEILVFAIIFILIYVMVKKVVVEPMKSINRSLSKITGGSLEERVNIRSNVEYEALSDDINATVEALNQSIKEAEGRIDAELAFAKTIQSSVLPVVTPQLQVHAEFEIAATMKTAKEVGGDFYDFYMVGEDTLCFMIADVSGKGIPAAMFMMRAKTELRTLTESGLPLEEVFNQSNKALSEGNDAGMFVTAWQGMLNLKTGALTFVNAGHNPPFIKKADGSFEMLRTRPGFVLAGLPFTSYRSETIQLSKNDVLFLYTDGVTEATTKNQELFSEARLQSCLDSNSKCSMKELCQHVLSEVDSFVGEASQFDDITMVALTYKGVKAIPSKHLDEATLEELPSLLQFVEEHLDNASISIGIQQAFSISLDEIYSNIVKYAYPKAKGPMTLELQIEERDRTIQMTFYDEGIPYNPLNTKEPDTTLSAEEREIGGLGVYMVKKLMDDVQYLYINKQNILILKKHF